MQYKERSQEDTTKTHELKPLKASIPEQVAVTSAHFLITESKFHDQIQSQWGRDEYPATHLHGKGER